MGQAESDRGESRDVRVVFGDLPVRLGLKRQRDGMVMTSNSANGGAFSRVLSKRYIVDPIVLLPTLDSFQDTQAETAFPKCQPTSPSSVPASSRPTPTSLPYRKPPTRTSTYTHSGLDPNRPSRNSPPKLPSLATLQKSCTATRGYKLFGRTSLLTLYPLCCLSLRNRISSEPPGKLGNMSSARNPLARMWNRPGRWWRSTRRSGRQRVSYGALRKVSLACARL